MRDSTQLPPAGKRERLGMSTAVSSSAAARGAAPASCDRRCGLYRAPGRDNLVGMFNVADLAVVHLVATAGMAAVLWVVQLAVYPLFDGIEAAGFTAYHRRYTRSVTWIVGPLMLTEATSALVLVAQGARGPLFLGSLVALATLWLMTFLVQAPLHRRLARGYKAPVQRQLVLTNWFRTIAWTARAVLVGLWLRSLSVF